MGLLDKITGQSSSPATAASAQTGGVDGSHFSAETQKAIGKLQNSAQHSGGFGDFLGIGKRMATTRVSKSLVSDGYTAPQAKAMAQQIATNAKAQGD